MKKILLFLIITFSFNIYAKDNTILKDLFVGATIKTIDKIKNEFRGQRDSYIEKYLIDNKYEIMDTITNEVYLAIENQYNLLYNVKIKEFNKLYPNFSEELMTQSQKIELFDEIMHELLNYYGYENKEIKANINSIDKSVNVTIYSDNKIESYDRQLFYALITNTLKGITTEEYNINIDTN